MMNVFGPRLPRLGPAIAALVLTLTLALPHGASQASLLPEPIMLKQSATVEGPMVRLGDIFTGLDHNPELAATAIAKAPALGQELQLPAQWLASIAIQHQVAWQPRSQLDQVVVHRASQVVGRSEIDALVRQGLAAQGVSGEFQLVFDDPGVQLLLPSNVPAKVVLGDLHYEHASRRFLGHLSAAHAQTQVKPLRISGKTVRMAQIPVLSHRMQPGEVITERDVEWISVAAHRVDRNAVTDLEDLVTLTPRRPIAAGEVVRANQLEIPIVVEKNSLITMQLVSGAMVLTVQGRALEDGAQGEVIRVMNSASRTVVNGVVTNANLVQVKLPGAHLASAQ